MTILRELLTILTDWALGPACPLCGDRRRGPRTLAAHLYVDHGDAS